MYTIENNILKVIINPAGAELNSLFNKSSGLEYLWSGDAKFWGKKSPILFPVVGIVTIVLWTAWAFIISGIFDIILAFQIKKIKIIDAE